MPPARTPSRVAAGRPPGGRKPPTDGRPPGGGGSGGFFRRFRAAQQQRSQGGGLGTLIRDVRTELKKVEWPTREELTKLTAAIIVLSALVGSFLGGVDFVFQEFFKWIIELTGGGV